MGLLSLFLFLCFGLWWSSHPKAISAKGNEKGTERRGTSFFLFVFHFVRSLLARPHSCLRSQWMALLLCNDGVV